MRIKLDLQDYSFSTLYSGYGKHRALVVKVGDKPFCCMRTVESYMEQFNGDYSKAIDDALVAEMEHALTKMLVDAAAAIPDGTEILPERTNAA